MNVGLLLRGIKSADIQRGQVIAAPRTIRPRLKFKGEVYVLSKDEGGRHTPFFGGYREVAVENVPHDLFTGDQFGDLLLGVMDVLIPVRELLAESVGTPLDVSGPPSTNVIDGGEDFVRARAHRETGREMRITHNRCGLLVDQRWMVLTYHLLA